MSYSRTILSGNVGNDPDIRTTNNGSGDRVASLSIATSEHWTDKATGERKESTEWHRVVCFNQKIIEVMDKYVKKGSKVLVEGQNKTRVYTDKEGIERKITEVVIGRFNGLLSLEGKPAARGADDEHSYGTARTAEATTSTKPSFSRSDLDDEVPF